MRLFLILASHFFVCNHIEAYHSKEYQYVPHFDLTLSCGDKLRLSGDYPLFPVSTSEYLAQSVGFAT